MDTQKGPHLHKLATLVGILGTLVGILGTLVGIISAALKGGPALISMVGAIVLLGYVVYTQVTTPRSQIALGALIGVLLGGFGIVLLLT